MTGSSPSVFCQKILHMHEDLFTGIWGQRGGWIREGQAPALPPAWGRREPETLLLQAQRQKRMGQVEPLLCVGGGWRARLGAAKEPCKPPGDRHTDPPHTPGAFLICPPGGTVLREVPKALEQSGRSTLNLTFPGGVRGREGCWAVGDADTGHAAPRGCEGPQGGSASPSLLSSPSTRALSRPVSLSVFSPSGGPGGGRSLALLQTCCSYA